MAYLFELSKKERLAIFTERVSRAVAVVKKYRKGKRLQAPPQPQPPEPIRIQPKCVVCGRDRNSEACRNWQGI